MTENRMDALSTTVITSTVNKELRELYRPLDPKTSVTIDDRRKLRADYREDEVTLSSLAEIAVKTIAKNITLMPDVVGQIPGHELELFYVVLSTSLDPLITAPIIDEGRYWERCTLARWPEDPVYPSRKTRYSWKRLFLERFVGEYLENLEPGYIDYEEVASVCKTLAPYVRTLEIKKLLPARYTKEETSAVIEKDEPSKTEFRPKKGRAEQKGQRLNIEEEDSASIVKSIVEEEPVGDSSTSEEERELKVIPDRLDLSVPLFGLNKLREVKLELGMMNYGKAGGCPGKGCHEMALLSPEDGGRLGKGLGSLGPRLRALTLHRSLLQNPDLLFRIVSPHLLQNTALDTVDFSYCRIDDRAAEILARELVAKHVRLRYLRLKGNLIGDLGTYFLSNVLATKPCPSLKTLDLSFNPVGKTGGRCLAAAVRKNNVLAELNVMACDLAEAVAVDFARSLWYNATLVSLDLRNNPLLSDRTARAVLEMLDINRTIQSLDMRGCGFHSDTLQAVKLGLWKNKERARGVEPVPRKKTDREPTVDIAGTVPAESLRQPETEPSGRHSWSVSVPDGQLTPEMRSELKEKDYEIYKTNSLYLLRDEDLPDDYKTEGRKKKPTPAVDNGYEGEEEEAEEEEEEKYNSNNDD